MVSLDFCEFTHILTHVNKNKILNMITINDIPKGYVKIEPGEDMLAKCWLRWHYQLNDPKDIKCWHEWDFVPGTIRINNDDKVWAIKKAPAPAPPAPKYQYKLITNIEIGDLFINKNGMCGIIITRYGYGDWDDKTYKYSISGYSDSLNNYSNCQGISKNDMLEHINNQQYIFITNINDKIAKTFKAARKLV